MKTKEIIKARALGIEEEQERDYQLKVTYDVGVGVGVGAGAGELNNEYNDDYDDQVSFLTFSYFFLLFYSNSLFFIIFLI